jgi:aldehyde dehydrogenase (NAD+)
MNQYLDAVVAKDPKRLPLSADVKYTEQEQVMAVGDGFWKTVTGRGNYNHFFSDPVAGQENHLPFGGVNQSGTGSYHGVFGFRTFSHQRAIYVQAT